VTKATALSLERAWAEAPVAATDAFVPQRGDCVFYFGDGHQSWANAYPDFHYIDAGRSDAPWSAIAAAAGLANHGAHAQVQPIECMVAATRFEFPHEAAASLLENQGPAVCMAAVLRPTSFAGGGGGGGKKSSSGRSGTVEVLFRPLFDLPDFMVPAYKVKRALAEGWTEGDRCRVLYGDSAYEDGVIAAAPQRCAHAASSSSGDGGGGMLPLWEGVAVRFDSEPDAISMVSEWELERPSDYIHPPPGLSASLSSSSALVRGPGTEPPRLAPALAAKLARRVSTALATEPAGYLFGDFITETVAPGYARQVPAQAHLALCLARLKPGSDGSSGSSSSKGSGGNGCYYRHFEALLDDLDRIVANCREFNGLDAPIADEAASLVERLKLTLEYAVADSTAGI